MNSIALTAALVAVGLVTGANAAFAGMTISGQQDSVDNEGLGVKYVPKMMRDVGALNYFAKKKRGKDGPPLLHLDWKTGADKVLTSDGYDGVGAIINGFIQFETEGTHRFAMETNDGTRITLGGQLILEDPDVHPDRFSEIVDVEVPEPGWYPVEILYFERRNTSTLRLLTSGPDGGELAIIDPVRLGH